MAPARKEDVDLWLVLTHPACARQWIGYFNWECHFPEGKPAAITTDEGREIRIATMDDNEAVVLAMHLLRKFELPIAESDFLYAEALGLVC